MKFQILRSRFYYNVYYTTGDTLMTSFIHNYTEYSASSPYGVQREDTVGRCAAAFKGRDSGLLRLLGYEGGEARRVFEPRSFL